MPSTRNRIRQSLILMLAFLIVAMPGSPGRSSGEFSLDNKNNYVYSVNSVVN